MAFNRILKEESFNFIAVDNFIIDVVRKASVFFLTHYHSDHFEGLRYVDEARKVGQVFTENPDKLFYCSDITKRIFESDRGKRCFIPSDQIISKPIGEPFIILGPKRSDREFDGVTVTFIPSGHILGAVMILFEHEKECSLFTGDFRIYPKDIPRIKALHDSNGDRKTITHLYLDTTFGSKQFPSFPLRSEVSKFVAEFVSDWLSRSTKNKVHFHILYPFAYESFIIDLSRYLKCKIMVDSYVYEKYYKYFPDISAAVFPAPDVLDENADMKYRIHISTSKHRVRYHILKNCKFCQRGSTSSIQLIRPVAKYFTVDKEDYRKSFNEFSNTDMLNVPYSTHCSLEELQEFVKYINPTEITTICKDNQDFKDNILSLISKHESSPNDNNNAKPSQIYEINESYYSKHNDNGCGLDSPPR